MISVLNFDFDYMFRLANRFCNQKPEQSEMNWPIVELLTFWPEVHIINGRPRHPQSQGLVKIANDAMNVQTVRATGKSPYSFVFGKDPMCHFSILDDSHKQNIADEKALPDNFS
ncbi:KRAB-A domain-containing protein 2-like [Rhizophagus irregularis DAOM 181602=DAOM 197198]|nr:KRAB-A domain-containing protein 2-like [Rhizophagus irregularis DAOM 181602=DAOM 197198]